MSCLILKMRKTRVEFTRHQLREMAFQALFSMLYKTDVTADQAIDNVLDYNMNVELEEAIEQPMYLRVSVEGVTTHQEEIDGLIQTHLKGWKINRISKADLIILRLAIFEMLYLSDIPSKVSLNEALELAKEFSDDESRRFINGVLSSVMADLDSNK